jgi:hypothetical protein
MPCQRVTKLNLGLVEKKLNCHKCGSQNLKKYALVYSEGTSTEEIYATVKPKWNTNPFGPKGKQKVTGTRTVQTALAQRCSQPSDPSNGVISVATIPALIIGIYIGFKVGGFTNISWVGFIAFIFTLGGFIYGCHKVWLRYMGGAASMKNYRQKLYDWHHSWLCMQCGAGTIFIS